MHEIHYLHFDEKTTQSDIQKEIDAFVIHNSDSHHAGSPIRFYPDLCENEEEAEKFIQSHDNHWYDQLGVKYLTPLAPVTSKKLYELKNQKQNLVTKIHVLERKPHFKEVKSAFISCRNCESKINTDYIRISNFCPVCKVDMRPATVRNRIAKMRNKLKIQDAKINEEVKALEAKAPKKVMYLVKTEYHT